MDQNLANGTNDSSVIWECSLCQGNRGKSSNTTTSQKRIYCNQNDFKDHYDRTCHICFSEFTSKITKDQHQVRHSDGISKHCKSLCSLCGKKFKKNPLFLEHAKYKHSPWKCIGCSYKSKDFTLLFEHVETCKGYYKKRSWIHRRKINGIELLGDLECFACGSESKGGFPSLLLHFIACDMALREDEKRIVISKPVIVQNINHYAANPNVELHCQVCNEIFENLSSYAGHKEGCENMNYMKNDSLLHKNGAKWYKNGIRVVPNSSNINIRPNSGTNGTLVHNKAVSVRRVRRISNEDTEVVQIVRPVIRKRKPNFTPHSANLCDGVEHSDPGESNIKCCKVNIEKLSIIKVPNHNISSPKAFSVFTKVMPRKGSNIDCSKDLMIKKIFPVTPHVKTNKSTKSSCLSIQPFSTRNSSSGTDRNDSTRLQIPHGANNGSQTHESYPLQCNGGLDLNLKDSPSNYDIQTDLEIKDSNVSSNKPISCPLYQEAIVNLAKHHLDLDQDINYLKCFLYLTPVVELKKLNLKSTSINIRVPHLSNTPFTHNLSYNETQRLTEDSTHNGHSITSQNKPYPSSPFEKIQPPKYRLVKKKLKKRKKKKPNWEAPFLKFSLPVILVERLSLKHQFTNILEGSLPTQVSSIDTLPLPPTFDFKYLDFEKNEILGGTSDLHTEHKISPNTKVTLQMYPNDPLLVGVTESNAWVHKSINSQSIHTQQSTLQSQDGEQENAYEILDSRTITIECINESESDEEKEVYKKFIKKVYKNQSTIQDTNHRRKTNFNPILNLDGLK